MNLTIDLNTIIQLSAYIVVAAVVIISTRDSLKMITDRLCKHDDDISGLKTDQGEIRVDIARIEGKIAK
jgi:hypothetical protein